MRIYIRNFAATLLNFLISLLTITELAVASFYDNIIFTMNLLFRSLSRHNSCARALGFTASFAYTDSISLIL